jgi:hypothetical protein
MQLGTLIDLQRHAYLQILRVEYLIIVSKLSTVYLSVLRTVNSRLNEKHEECKKIKYEK